MMSITHAAIALTTVSISLGTGNTYILGTAILGSQLPDLDSTESMIGRSLYPIARFIESRFAHRTITHSFLSTGMVAIAASPLLFFHHWQFWVALVLGQFTGWFADCFTRSGASAFYPNPARLVIPGNPRARLSTHSAAEYWVLGIACFLAIASINLASAGGVTEQFGRAFFPDTATAANLFQKYGSEQLITVEVQGLHVHTSQAIADTFTVIDATENALIGESQTNGKLYKIGSGSDVQIRPSRVKATLSGAIAITAQQLDLQDIAVANLITKLPAAAYLSGSLLLDDMEEVQIPVEIESYPTVRVFGGQVELSNARLTDLALLRDFWVLSGRIIVKERR